MITLILVPLSVGRSKALRRVRPYILRIPVRILPGTLLGSSPWLVGAMLIAAAGRCLPTVNGWLCALLTHFHSTLPFLE